MEPTPTPGPGSLVHITAMTPADWDAVRRIWVAGIATGHATFEVEPPNWESFDAAKLTDHRLVARGKRDEVLGWAAVSSTSARPAYAGVVEHSVYVATEGRGRGIGHHLLQQLIISTEQAGIWTLQASVFPENSASLRLHQATGFRRVGERRAIARMTHGPLAGQWRDTVLLERRAQRVDT